MASQEVMVFAVASLAGYRVAVAAIVFTSFELPQFLHAQIAAYANRQDVKKLAHRISCTITPAVLSSPSITAAPAWHVC
jgi:hypothetical protein